MHSRAVRNFVIRTWPRHHDKLHQPHHILPAPPRSNIRERVGADQKPERPGPGRQQLFNRVDRIAGIGILLNPRNLKSRIDGARQFHHADAILPRGDRIPCLVRWIASRYEKDAVQSKSLQRRSRYREMSVVNRIESSAEDRCTRLNRG